MRFLRNLKHINIIHKITCAFLYTGCKMATNEPPNISICQVFCLWAEKLSEIVGATSLISASQRVAPPFI
jgi:hypothetical protein